MIDSNLHVFQRLNTGAALRRRQLLGTALALPLVGCGGGGGGADGGGGGGGGATASGSLVLKSTKLYVVNAATKAGVEYPATATTNIPGVGVSRNGLFGDVWDYFGGDQWHITIRNLSNAQMADYTVGGLLGFPTSAAALNADATRLAYSVNELASAGSSTRVDRTYVNNLGTGALVAAIDNREEPVFVDNGELLLRSGDRLYVYNAQLADQGALPITVNARFGSFSASPNGRYVAYESGSRLRVHDRSTGTSWQATDELSRTHYAPVFSPDGQWLAFLRAGVLASQYLVIIPFVANSTRTIGDADEVRSPGGEYFSGSGRIGWAR